MLHSALERNAWEEVKQLLNIPYINVNEPGKNLQTPLHVVCEEGVKDLVEVLLDKKADPNQEDKTSFTPIHYAAKQGQLEIIEILLGNPKLDLTKKTSAEGFTVVHFLSMTSVNSNKEALYIKILSKLKENGLNLVEPANSKDTPLHLAASHGNYCGAEYLLEHNANIDAQNS